MMLDKKWIQFASVYWPTLVLVVTPLALLPLLTQYGASPSNKCLYVVLLMAVYWATEAMPLAITSMIPIVLFPALSIMDTVSTCSNYMGEATMMFIGGIMIALAIEQSDLHTRVALIIIGRIGCSPRKLTIGLFSCTSAVSMWISNTAAISIMIPIIMGVLKELEAQGLCNMYEDLAPPFQDQRKVIVHDRLKPSKTTLCYFLGSAFCASIGGCGTIIGSGPSIILKGVFEARFPQAPELDFNKWLFFNFPLVVFGTFLTWVYLQWLYMGMFRPDSEEAQANRKVIEIEHVAQDVVQAKLRELGPMNLHQKSVAILFFLTMIAYLTRNPGFIRGWGTLFDDGSVRDTTASLIVVTLLFILPRNYDFLTFFTVPENKLPKRASLSLLTWQFVQERMEWDVVFLLGGGFALSDGGKHSGLNQRTADFLTSFGDLPPLLMVMAITSMIQLTTEITSNLAIASLILPALAEMAVAAKMHPLYLMIPACLACNYSFLLPVSTPPNAIVASFVKIPTKEMVKAGLGPTAICLLILWALCPTWGKVIYPEWQVYPDWARKNGTVREFSILEQ